MRKVNLTIIYLCLLFVGITFSSTVEGSEVLKQYENFKKIKLFTSTKGDVEKLFKYSRKKESSKKNGSEEITYYLKDAVLTVSYSTGKCASGNNNFKGYDVDEGLVIRIDLFFYKHPRVSSFKLNMKTLETYKSYDSGAMKFYNDDTGIEFEGSKTHIVSVSLNPTETQRKMYNCVNLSSTTLIENTVSETPLYGTI
jgi:hypothetical protein